MAEEARRNIPSPRGYPLVGNLLDIQDEVPIQGLERLIDLCGPIAKFTTFGKETVLIGSVALLEELSDEKRFWKSPASSLSAGRSGPRGLFVAESEDEPDWQVAHRTLMPSFGPLAIEGMFEEMYDIATQLALKFARQGPSYRITATSDFTRLTLDTIALCAMGYRFNSFYQDDLHPFVKAMNNTLAIRSDSAKVSSIVQRMLPWDRTMEKAQADGQYMRQLGEELVSIRRKNPTDKADLLNSMIYNKDPKTGEKMSDGLISSNMLGFLIAGHETTSGLLSFAFLLLLQNPEAYHKLQEEIDREVGRDRLDVKHLDRLAYADAVLRETLRLHPTAPAYVRSIRSDNPNDNEFLADGKYAISRSDRVVCLIGKIQRDPAVFGEDADEFRPDRMISEQFKQLPHSAWKPFGTGVRSCIGRAFAWQEAKICLALLFQNFDFRLDDPLYRLKVKQTLTIKPDGFYMRASLRQGMTSTSLQNSLFTAAATGAHGKEDQTSNDETANSDGSDAQRITILYGSNSGTCQALAQRLAMDCTRHSLQASVMTMDEALGVLPTEQPVIVITASYEGEPPDNAARFVTWLRSSTIPKDLTSVAFAVFGCGHSDWASTYQRIPSDVDSLLAKYGASRIVERGLVDASHGSMVDEFERWCKNTLWPALHASNPRDSKANQQLKLDVELETRDRADLLHQPDFFSAVVVKSESLTAAGEPEKRHLQIRLPEGISYTAGDYITVLPQQPLEKVKRVCKQFGISEDTTMTIPAGSATYLPTNTPMSVTDVLRGYVELSSPATRSDVEACIVACSSPDDTAALQKCLENPDKQTTLLDLLNHFSSITLSFGTFLSHLPPLRPRFYSVSSSPSVDPQLCSITYSVLSTPTSWSGEGSKDNHASEPADHHVGVAGAFMSHLQPSDELSVSIRATNRHFRLPRAAESVPIIMLCTGTGFAPFRGFVQERMSQLMAGRTLAPALLFVGCRSASGDRLFGPEVDAWVKAGAVDVRYAFSREPEASEGCKYVQERLWKDRKEVSRLWGQGAKVFTCCGSAVAKEISHVAVKILCEHAESRGDSMSETDARSWLQERRNERLVADVFG